MLHLVDYKYLKKLAETYIHVIAGSVEAAHKRAPARKVPVMVFSPTPPTTVFVAKPFEISYADAMRGMRVWLDHEKLQPATFKVASDGKIGFEITFSTEQEALAFRRFKWLRY